MPELRIDPTTGRRVYIAEERAGRPSDYAFQPLADGPAAVRRESCPFCAGNEAATPHASAARRDAAGNWLVRVVPNKYPAVSATTASSAAGQGSALFDRQDAAGLHEVVIESPEHLTELTELDLDQLTAVLAMFRDRLRHCASLGTLQHATVFKNSGFAAGASLEHLHSQIVALPYVPDLIETELRRGAAWHAAHGQCVFCSMVERERAGGARLVLEESGYAAVCAYAGRQPFEAWILPTRHAARFDQVVDAELRPLAVVLQALLGRLARACRRRTYPLAYNLILHTAPFDDAHEATYHWHWELIPRATHLAGLEWGAGVYINPVSPERAARELREA